MRIDDICRKASSIGRPTLSFEVFPPKGQLPAEEAQQVASQLAALHPDFISVTYSAAGSGNSGATADVADVITNGCGVPVMAHLTCMGAAKQQIESRIQDYSSRGIHNVLALRGDPIEGASASDFEYAKDLIPLLKDAGFSVGAAAYPEGHLECLDLREDVKHLREKQEAGADFFISQLFFDNNAFFSFLVRARAAGVVAPIIAGIMPFASRSQLERMVFACGASLPAPIVKLLARYEGHPESLKQAGVEYAAGQIIELIKEGVSGVHVYTMNKPDITAAILDIVRAEFPQLSALESAE